MLKQIAVCSGDGSTSDAMKQAEKVLQAVGGAFHHQFAVHHVSAGACARAVPEHSLRLCRRTDAVFWSPAGDRNPSAAACAPESCLRQMRDALSSYARVRQVKSLRALLHPTQAMGDWTDTLDAVVITEIEPHSPRAQLAASADSAVDFDGGAHRRRDIRRVAQLAFLYALRRGAILAFVRKTEPSDTSVVWSQIVDELRARHPAVPFRHGSDMLPAKRIFSTDGVPIVILAETGAREILDANDEIAVAAYDLIPAASVGDGTPLFEIDSANRARSAANPLAAILSVAMMLEQFDMPAEARHTREAVDWCVRHRLVTRDLDSQVYYSTAEIGAVAAEYIADTKSIRASESLGESTII